MSYRSIDKTFNMKVEMTLKVKVKSFFFQIWTPISTAEWKEQTVLSLYMTLTFKVILVKVLEKLPRTRVLGRSMSRLTMGVPIKRKWFLPYDTTFVCLFISKMWSERVALLLRHCYCYHTLSRIRGDGRVAVISLSDFHLF